MKYEETNADRIKSNANIAENLARRYRRKVLPVVMYFNGKGRGFVINFLKSGRYYYLCDSERDRLSLFASTEVQS